VGGVGDFGGVRSPPSSGAWTKGRRRRRKSTSDHLRRSGQILFESRTIPTVANFPQAIAADLDYSPYQIRTNGRRILEFSSRTEFEYCRIEHTPLCPEHGWFTE
jgi:hypothetical protein